MKWTGRFEQYNLSAFRNDIISGLVVGVIAIPLGMAFAIASGVKPEYGIYTTIVAGILISLFGGSKYQIGGPTGAFVPILFGIVLQYGYDSLLIAGFLAGIMLIAMGLFKIGGFIRFIPRPVTIGFTTGIAVLIFSGQLANFMGLEDVQRHEDFLSNMAELARHLSSINLNSIIIAAISLTVILVCTRYMPRLPGALLGLLVSTAVAAIWFQGDTATIGSAYGAIPSSFPSIHLPNFTWDRIQTLLLPAFIIAMLGGIESLLSAVVADNMTGTKHNSNRELIGQGIANMVTPLFGGIPATGAIARTAANIKSGAQSPLSGVIHAVVVLLVLLFLAPYASYIPLASMAPVLMMVAWNMSERKSFAHILKTKTNDTIVLLLTFGLTVLANLSIAVVVGIISSIILFTKGMSASLTVTRMLPNHNHKQERLKAAEDQTMQSCPLIAVYRVDGPFFFGGANSFQKPLEELVEQKPRILVFQMERVPYMDTTGEGILAGILRYASIYGGKVMLSGMQPQPMKVLRNTGLLDRIGASNLYEHADDAIHAAVGQLDPSECAGCKRNAFPPCNNLSVATASQKVDQG